MSLLREVASRRRRLLSTLAMALLAAAAAPAFAATCIDAGVQTGSNMGAKINTAVGLISTDGCIAIPPGTHSGIATPVNLGTKRITLRGAGQAATKLVFTSAISDPAISISQGGQSLQDIHRFELADFTIVNESTTEDTISIAGVQGSPALVHNVAIHGGLRGLVIDNCNSNGFRDLTIYDPVTDGIYNDVTDTGDNYFSNVTVIAAENADAGIHIEAQNNAQAYGPYLTNVKVYGDFDYGFKIENSSGTRNDVYAFLTTCIADSTFAQGAYLFDNVRNVRITQSWAVNHSNGSTSAAWKFDNSGVVELSDSVGYSTGQGDVALIGGSADIGISDSTLSGSVRHFYLDTGTPPTAIHYSHLQLLSGSALSNSASTLETATALQSGVQSSGGFVTGGFQVQSSNGNAKLFVEETASTTTPRELAELRNNGGSVLILRDSSVSQRWAIGTSGGNLVFDNQASGGTEFTFGSTGNFTALGTKSFLHADPGRPGAFLKYVALEGPEAGVFTRGSARTKGGVARISLPGYFSRIVEPGSLTVQVTATGSPVPLFVASKNERQAVVRSANGKDVAFDYLVHGVRKGYLDYQVEVTDAGGD